MMAMITLFPAGNDTGRQGCCPAPHILRLIVSGSAIRLRTARSRGRNSGTPAVTTTTATTAAHTAAATAKAATRVQRLLGLHAINQLLYRNALRRPRKRIGRGLGIRRVHRDFRVAEHERNWVIQFRRWLTR